jgi:hypothetical protein
MLKKLKKVKETDEILIHVKMIWSATRGTQVLLQEFLPPL